MERRDDDSGIGPVKERDAEALVPADLLERVESEDGMLVKPVQAEGPNFFDGIEQFLYVAIEGFCLLKLLGEHGLERLAIFPREKYIEFLLKSALLFPQEGGKKEQKEDKNQAAADNRSDKRSSIEYQEETVHGFLRYLSAMVSRFSASVKEK